MEDILKDCYSDFFIQGMKNRLVVSHFKYGSAKKTYPELAQALKCIKERIELYEKTKNTEYLIDAANFCMLEFMYPCIKVLSLKLQTVTNHVDLQVVSVIKS